MKCKTSKFESMALHIFDLHDKSFKLAAEVIISSLIETRRVASFVRHAVVLISARKRKTNCRCDLDYRVEHQDLVRIADYAYIALAVELETAAIVRLDELRSRDASLRYHADRNLLRGVIDDHEKPCVRA